MHSYNITDPIRELAVQRPDQTAIVYVRTGRPPISLSFSALDSLCSRYAAGFRQMGIVPGERVLILARPDENFVPFVLGLLRAGGVVAMVDPGRPVGEFLNCIAEIEPSAVLAEPLVHAATWLFPRAFGKVTRRITTRGRFPKSVQASRIGDGQDASFVSETDPDSEAAVIFTTGSTGSPKGVVYTHGILRSQSQALQGMLNLSGAERGLFGASAMMLLGLISGATVVVADLLNSMPQALDVTGYAQLLAEYQITLAFAAPVLCRRLVQVGKQKHWQFPHLRQLVIGGAPVDAGLIAALHPMLPHGEAVVSLGATEAMPISMIRGQTALEKSNLPGREFAGVCAGYACAGHDLRIIAVQEGPISAWNPSLCLLPGQIGEIVIRGPVVTPAYLRHPELTALAKIPEGELVWHRTGDVGFLDEQGCLWFCGRKSQRVETSQGVLWTLPCEAVFNRHPAVVRSALVGVGPRGLQIPVMVIECQPDLSPRSRSEQLALAQELLQSAETTASTRLIHQVAFFPGTFPVDIRHNSKINREKLAVWVKRHPRAVIGRKA